MRQRDLCKKCRSLSDATIRGLLSGSTLLVIHRAVLGIFQVMKLFKIIRNGIKNVGVPEFREIRYCVNRSELNGKIRRIRYRFFSLS